MTIKSIKTGWTGISAAAGNLQLGDFESIATVTVGAGGQATIEFTSIPSTYQHLQIRGIARNTGTTFNALSIRFNSDSASNYSSHRLSGGGSAASSNADTSVSAMYPNELMPLSSAGANVFGVGIFDILDYANTNKYKTLRNLSGFDNNGSGNVALGSGSWRSTSAITSVQLIPQSNNFAQYSHFALYGIKG